VSGERVDSAMALVPWPPDAARRSSAHLVHTVHTDLLIDGRWRPSTTSMTFPVVEPATGLELRRVADAAPEDGVSALAAAAAARQEWAGTPPRERAEVLHAARARLLERRDAFAALVTSEMGKPVAEARGEVDYAADYLEWFAEEAVRIDGRYLVAPRGDARLLTMRQPVGPCLLIAPWNFPIAMGARKIAPALAAGCTTVVKPAPQTPLSMLALAEVFQEVGLPAGVLNVITTSDAEAVTAPLLRDARLRKLSFTGSTAVGRLLAERSGHQLLRVSLELGGNAPFLVFDDADLDAAVEGAIIAKLRNGGEACTAANRFLVHEAVADSFARRLADRMTALTVGPGLEDTTDVGPLIDEAARSKVAALVDDAVARGARTLCGGSALPGPGTFYAPTVLVDVPAGARIAADEIFGPVAAIYSFSTEEEAIARANATEHGLVAYVYTRDVARALHVSEALETGMVGLNRGVVSNAAAPFGGVKASGYGREGGHEGIDEYLQLKYVAVDV
jgi:succinate-semialdehyde dehydrogenase/glutarate-semialdehyde dehydrogenase